MPSTTATDPSLGQALRWLTAHAGFPAQRLPAKMELLVLLAAAATEEQRVTQAAQKSGGSSFGAQGGLSTGAQMRNYTIQRRRANVKCDNSAKV